MKKIIFGSAMLAGIFLAGCSDTKESLLEEKKELKADFQSQANDCKKNNDMNCMVNVEKEAKEAEKDWKERMRKVEEAEE